MNAGFWKDKKVLVTGHTGFKGSWLCLVLRRLGAEVMGYSLPAPTTPSLYELSNVESDIKSINGDVCDAGSLFSAISEYQPEIVLHLAAQALVRRSYTEPVETFMTNAVGTLNVLESIRKTSSVKAVVNVTTDKCYENKEWVWPYRENEPLQGHDPYSSSKVCSEQITIAYRNSYFSPDKYSSHGVGVGSARAGNVIGGGDWAEDRLVPDCMRAWIDGQDVIIRNPGAIRPWQHVLESLSGYLLLAEKLYLEGGAYSQAWNFGPDQNSIASVEQAIDVLKTHWGAGVNWKLDKQSHPHEAHTLKLDSTKAIVKLGWKPRWDLQTALKKTADWYKVYQSQPSDCRRITLQQIDEYIEG